ncbi:unnamed protein product, partial [Rotaria sp. Silwood2]
MAIPVIVYNHARFDPFDTHNVLANLVSVSSENACLCECYSNSMCLTATYFAIGETCSLYSAPLSEGQLRVVPTSANTKVYNFENMSVAG